MPISHVKTAPDVSKYCQYPGSEAEGLFKRRWLPSQTLRPSCALLEHTFIPLPPVSNPHLSLLVGLSALNTTAQIKVRHRTTHVTITSQSMNKEGLCRAGLRVSLAAMRIRQPTLVYSDYLIQEVICMTTHFSLVACC